jgi:hypothetical protein
MKGGETWRWAEWQRRQNLIVPFAIASSTCCEQMPPGQFDPSVSSDGDAVSPATSNPQLRWFPEHGVRPHERNNV